MVKATAESEAGVMPSEQLLTDMGNYNQQLIDAGIMQGGEGLRPSLDGVRIRFRESDRTVVNGPFSETRELIAGFWIWRVQSMDEAIAWVKRCPNPMEGESWIEIRTIFEADDFGDAFTPAAREQEARQRGVILGLAPLRLETRGPLPVVGLSGRFGSDAFEDLSELWQRFAPQIGQVPGQVGTTAYGVSWNFSTDGQFDHLAGVELAANSPLPAGLEQVTVPAGTFVVFPYPGHISALPATWRTIWSDWFPASGYQPTHGSCVEQYSSEFNPATGTGGIELWIPIQT